MRTPSPSLIRKPTRWAPSASTSARTARYAEDVERIAREEIGGIRDAGFTEEEIADAKRCMIGSHYIRMQTNGAIASSMCLDAIYGLEPGFYKVWPEKGGKNLARRGEWRRQKVPPARPDGQTPPRRIDASRMVDFTAPLL